MVFQLLSIAVSFRTWEEVMLCWRNIDYRQENTLDCLASSQVDSCRCYNIYDVKGKGIAECRLNAFIYL
ncbi:hypothetical protein OWV82_008338 [Melia azedarach]|uniref:Uncharacterized protein n=1 Tax=Melia azedarach TaxID=155640 RepID=A0ACC1YB68_MELAZ|nr:hypothetical protein OWV82_008338 [Melia azedarach]